MAAAKKQPHERVMEFVERELKKNPEIGSSDLFKRAKKVSRTVSGMTIRQFHAKYPLQVKRRLAPKKSRKLRAKPGKPRKPAPRRTMKAPTANREAIRAILLNFAKDLRSPTVNRQRSRCWRVSTST